MFNLRFISVALLVVVQSTIGLGTDVLHRWLHRDCDHLASSHCCSTETHGGADGHDHSHSHGVMHHHALHSHANAEQGHAVHVTSEECRSATCDDSPSACQTTAEGWSTQSHDHDSCWVCRQLSRPMTWVEPVIVAVSTELVSVLSVESASLCAGSVARNYDGRGPPSIASLSA